MRRYHSEEGVSEMVGVILLVGLTVLAVAVAGVVLLSSSQPNEIPHATIVAGSKSGSFALVHEGGDPLRAGEYRIYIDRGSGLADETGNFTWPANGVWSIGGVLNHTDTDDANFTRVIVTVLTGDGSEMILAEVAFQGGGKTSSPDPVEPAEPAGPGAGSVFELFTANVTSGTAPLAVKFTDISGNAPTRWLWDFGDGTTSTEQHPEHTYMTSGTYTVSLNASNDHGFLTETKNNYITVTSSSTTRYDTLLNTAEGKPGYLMPGGYLEFRVTGAYSHVTIGGTQHNLENGSMVKLVIGTGGQGHIDISNAKISSFAYDDITLFVNGIGKGTGKINTGNNGIWVSNFDNLVSTLTLNVPSTNVWTEFTVGGTPIIDRVSDDRKITLYNLMPNKDGLMNLDNQPSPEKIYFIGSITSYTFG